MRLLIAGDQNFQSRIREVLDASDLSLAEGVVTSGALLTKLSQAAFDCILIDQAVGRQSAVQLHQLVAAKYNSPPPMIMMARQLDARTAIAAFRAGFSDYVAGDHDFANELVRAIRESVRRNRKQQSRLDEIEHLSKMAKYDRLTGLPNRSFLEDRLVSLIASGERHGSTFAVVLVDVNNFRKINDIYGHAIGDQALKAFAKKLMLTARSSDSLGRFGGDEFLYLIDRDVSYETVERACHRLTSGLSFSVELEAVGLSLSASIGAAIFPTDGTTPDTLLTAADRAMYAAKASGAGHCLAQAIETPSRPQGSIEAESRPSQRKGWNADGPSHGNGAAAGDSAPIGVLVDVARDDNAPIGHRSENRRSQRRNRVFIRGRIIFGNGFSTIDCMIRDLSGRGARISVEDQLAVPPTFSFAILDTGQVYTAARRWQRGRSIGLEFLVDAEEKPATKTQPASSSDG